MHFGPLEGRRRISSLGGTDQGFVVDLIGAKLSVYIYFKYIYREEASHFERSCCSVRPPACERPCGSGRPSYFERLVALCGLQLSSVLAVLGG